METQDGATFCQFCRIGDPTSIVNCLADAQPELVDSVDHRGYSALMCAIENSGAFEAVRILILEMGADIHFRRPISRMTPLHLACRTGNEKAAQLLVDVGANISDRDISGQNALHHAALGLSAKVFRRLLYYADPELINAPDASGYTPLLIASEHGRTAVVKMLLENGADCRRVSKLQHSAAELTDWYGHTKAFALVHAALSTNEAKSDAVDTTMSASAATQPAHTTAVAS